MAIPDRLTIMSMLHQLVEDVAEQHGPDVPVVIEMDLSTHATLGFPDLLGHLPVQALPEMPDWTLIVKRDERILPT